MKTLTLYQQKQTVTDKATGFQGRLHNICIELNESTYYSFVSTKCNPETKLPNKSYWIVGDRIIGGKTHSVALPLEFLGRNCRDVQAGVSGMVVTLLLNVNGCVHVELQPSGETKTGEPIERWNCSIRDLDEETQKLIPAGWAFNPETPSPSAPCRSYMS